GDVRIDHPEVGGARTRNGAIDIARPGVVGGHRQFPVAVVALRKILKVTCGSARRLFKAVALVDVSRLTQAVHTTGARNELPQYRSCGLRHRQRFPCTLDLTQPRDINRHAFLDEDLAREFHVLPGSSQTVFHRPAITTLVIIDELLNKWIERET